MKTNRIIFMLALAAAATACNKAELEGTDPAGLKSNQFLASLEGASTKVTMADDFSLSWVAGDQVSVFGEDLKNNLFTAAEGGDQTVLDGGEVTVDAEKTYYAVYPYSEKNSIVAGGVITTEIPTVQTPKQGDIPVNFAVARNDGQTFAFYNVCGLVGFEITEEDIVSVTVKANGAEEYLTGKINVTPSTAPSYEVVEGVSEVTLVTDGVFEKGYHYVAVLPQAFENGITVLMAKEDGTVATKTTTKSFTLNRSHRIDTRQIDADQSWTKLTSISNAAELQAFLAAADNYAAADVVTLAADIDLKGYDIVPAASFAGTFDGAGKSIKNWNTTTALFNEVSGTVKDLTIAESCNLEVQQQGNAAFIALANAGTISGCTNKGTVTSVSGVAFTSTAARMVGTIAAVSTGVISSCINDGSISLTPSTVNMAATQFVGGIVGQASGVSATSEFIVGCTNNGAVSFDPSVGFSCRLFIGGVCGGTPAGAGEFGDYGVIKSSKNTGAITLKSKGTSSKATYINLGGAVGYAEADIDDCDNEGDVTVDLPSEVAEPENVFQRPAIAGVAGTVMYNATLCDNSGDVDIKGIFGTGTASSIGAGQFHGSMFGGVFGAVGNDEATCSVTECTNTGSLTFDLVSFSSASPYGYIGGVAAKAESAMSDCSNTGVIDVKNRMRGGYVGGIVGGSAGALTSCDNGAPITYDLGDASKDEISGNQSSDLFLGGIAGLAESVVTDCGSLDASNITVRNGIYREDKVFSIGGLVGQGKGKVSSSKTNTYLYVRGGMEINTPSRVYVGGVAGQTSGQLIDLRVESTGTSTGASDANVINVTNLGSKSYVGGVCGLKTKTNDARLIMRTKVNVQVTDVTEVYLAQLYGCWDFAGYYHSGTINSVLNYSSCVTRGIVAGLVTAEGELEIGRGTNAVAIRSGCKYNGESLGTYSDLTELHSALVGKVDGKVIVTAIAQ